MTNLELAPEDKPVLTVGEKLDHLIGELMWLASEIHEDDFSEKGHHERIDEMSLRIGAIALELGVLTQTDTTKAFTDAISRRE